MSRTHRRIRRITTARREAGMTLVEIMIVVIIMAMIASAVGAGAFAWLNDAKEKTALTDTRAVRSAALAFQMDRGECPNMADLREAGLLDRQARGQDPWGVDFAVECTSDDIFVTSAGPDRQLGTEDDIPDEHT